MADEGKEQQGAESEEVESSGGGKVLVILTALNLVVTLGIVGVLFYSFQKESATPEISDIQEGESGHSSGAEEHADNEKGEPKGTQTGHKFGKMIQLEQFTVNLATIGSSAPKYARVKISLEVPADDAEIEVTQKMPQVRNTIIDLFNSKRPSDLANAEGRNFLKDEIKNSINSFLVTGKVTGVFLTNFALSS